MISDTIDRIVQAICKLDDENDIRNLLTTPDMETGMMPLTLMAMGRNFSALTMVLDQVLERCKTMTVIDIVGAQRKESRYDPSLDFEDPSDKIAYVPDPSWTLYHIYAAAGINVRERLKPIIESLPVKHNTISSGLFRQDRHGRTPFEVAMQNCDPTSAVLLLEKIGEVSKSLGLYDLKSPILDPLKRVSDDRMLLPYLYDKKEMGLLSNEQCIRMAKAYHNCDRKQMLDEMNLVLGTAIDYNDLGFLRSVFEAFPYAIDGHVFMDTWNEEDHCFGWERLCVRTEMELESNKKSETLNVPLSVLMLRDYMKYMTDANLSMANTNNIQEFEKVMSTYPLSKQALDELCYSSDTVAFYWAPDVVSERLRLEYMSREQEEAESDELHIG